MNNRAIVVVTRIAVAGAAGRGDLDPENKERAQLAGPNDVPTEEYVSDRFKIMERVAAPALKLCKRNINWVLLTCPERRDQVEELADKMCFTPWVADQDDNFVDDLVYTDKWITVRLDSDDAIRPGALDALHDVEPKAPALYNWAYGYQLNWLTGEVGLKSWPYRIQGPFLAISHESHKDMLDFGGPHTYARGDRIVHHVGDANFVMTIHERNQLSKFRPEHVLEWEAAGEALSEFGIGVPVNA